MVPKDAKKAMYWDVPMDKSMVASKDENLDAKKDLN